MQGGLSSRHLMQAAFKEQDELLEKAAEVILYKFYSIIILLVVKKVIKLVLCDASVGAHNSASFVVKIPASRRNREKNKQ